MTPRLPRHRIALLTGASSGIGEALAAALAAQGTHVLLAARSVPRLEALRARIETTGGRATVVPADLAAPGAARRLYLDVERLALPVDLLVNNAGVGFHGGFETEAPDQLDDMLQVNVVALTALTRQFVPGLLARQGTVLNIASTAAFQPAPFMAAYGATKAYVLSLSEALWAEYRGRGLHVVALCPGPVETPFLDAAGRGVRSSALFRRLLTVGDVVDAAMAALEARSPTRIVGRLNQLMAQSARLSPRALSARISAALLAPAGASNS
jgi:short-subunit dehydrogenase